MNQRDKPSLGYLCAAGFSTDGCMECGIWVTVAFSSRYQSMPMCDGVFGWSRNVAGVLRHASRGCLRSGLYSIEQTL